MIREETELSFFLMLTITKHIFHEFKPNKLNLWITLIHIVNSEYIFNPNSLIKNIRE